MNFIRKPHFHKKRTNKTISTYHVPPIKLVKTKNVIVNYIG